MPSVRNGTTPFAHTVLCPIESGSYSFTLPKSLLESAPFNRRDVGTPRYKGVGRVLVARLVIESYHQEAQGRLLVETHREAEGFYRKLGFSGLPYGIKQFKLYQLEARQLLQSVLGVS